MTANPSGIKSVGEASVQNFLNRVGSIHLLCANGQKQVFPFHELSPEKQEFIRKLLQLFLRSQSFLNHLEKHRGNFNIVYKEGKKRDIFYIAGKALTLEGEIVPEEEADRDLLAEVQSFSEPIAMTADVLSFVRNTVSSLFKSALANQHSPVSIVVEGAGALGGLAAIGGGGIMISKGVQKMANPKEDEEFNVGILQTLSGTGFWGFGIAATIYRVSSYFDSAVAAAVTKNSLTFGLNPALAAMNIGFILMGLYHVAITGSFRSEFNQAVEKGGARGGIEFLYQNLCLTEDEQNSPERDKILEQKHSRMARRIGNDAVKEFAPFVETLKKDFDAGLVDAERMENALSVLDNVSKANYQEIAKWVLFITVATLSLVSITAVGPTGTFVFFAALALLWFISDCSVTANFTTEQLWRLHQLAMGLIIAATDGRDEEFMKWLCEIDQIPEDADERVKANVYLEAVSELGGSVYHLFKKTRSNASKFLPLIDEIRRAKISGTLESSKDCLEALRKATPLFYAFLTRNNPSEDLLVGALEKAYASWRDQNPDMETLPREDALKHLSLFLLSSLYESEVKRAAVFDCFDDSQINDILHERETGIPLMQLGASLGTELSVLGRGKTAYDAVAYPEILLSENEKEILQRSHHFRSLAAEKFPDVFKQAIKNPPQVAVLVQTKLESDIEHLEVKEIKGKKYKIPKQTITDFHRGIRTRFQNKVVEEKGSSGVGEEGGGEIITSLHEMAKGDSELFYLLAALYGQTAKNFAVDTFQSEMARLGILSGLYMVNPRVKEQSFFERPDGSIEMCYEYLCTLTSELDWTEQETSLFATFRIEREGGRWVCRNPVFSDTIPSDGHPIGPGRLSQSSPL